VEQVEFDRWKSSLRYRSVEMLRRELKEEAIRELETREELASRVMERQLQGIEVLELQHSVHLAKLTILRRIISSQIGDETNRWAY